MIRQIFLHGPLAQEFGSEPISFNFSTPREAIDVLEMAHPGFKRYLHEFSELAFIKKDGDKIQGIEPEELQMTVGRWPELHLFVSAEGAGTGVVEAYLISAGWSAFAAWAGSVVVSIAVNYALSYVISSFAETTSPTNETKAQNTSTLFSGVENMSGQGGRVPLLFGTFRGSTYTLNQAMRDTRVTVGATDSLNVYGPMTSSASGAVTSTGIGTVNVFDNDYSKTAPTLVNFTVNGVTTAAGGMYSTAGYSVNATAAGVVTVTAIQNTYQAFTVVINATDAGTSFAQNLNVQISEAIDYSANNTGGDGSSSTGESGESTGASGGDAAGDGTGTA